MDGVRVGDRQALTFAVQGYIDGTRIITSQKLDTFGPTLPPPTDSLEFRGAQPEPRRTSDRREGRKGSSGIESVPSTVPHSSYPMKISGQTRTVPANISSRNFTPCTSTSRFLYNLTARFTALHALDEILTQIFA